MAYRPMDMVLRHIRRIARPTESAVPGDGVLVGQFVSHRDEAKRFSPPRVHRGRDSPVVRMSESAVGHVELIRWCSPPHRATARSGATMQNAPAGTNARGVTATVDGSRDMWLTPGCS
jgi:hypothetical protein